MRTYDDKYVEEVFNLIPEANFVAVDSYNIAFFCSFKPEIAGSIWRIKSLDENQGWLSKVNLNGLDWKDSLRERKWVPNEGDTVYTLDVHCLHDYFYEITYRKSSPSCVTWLERGLLFRTKEEAIEAAKRMLEAVKKG